MYTMEIPASGGAHINNDTEGYGWFTGFCTGVLPWRGPTIGFRRAALNDLFTDGGTASTNLEDFFDGTGYVGGTAKLTVDVTKIGGQTATAAGAVTVLASVGTAATSTAQTGDCYPLLNTELADLIADIGANGVGLTAIPWNAAWDAEVQSEVNDEMILQNLDHLLKTATAAVDMTTEVTDGSVISRIISNSDTSLYVPATSNMTTHGAVLIDIHDTDLPAVKTDTAAILVDTATIDTAGEIAAAVWSADATTYQTQGTFGQAIGDPVADTNTIYKAVVTDAAGATVGVDVVAVKADTAATLADTGELQTDWANGGRLDLIFDTIAADTTTDIPTLIDALPTAAEINAEVVDALNVDTYAEPTGVPPATDTLVNKIGRVYQALRNKVTVTATVKTFTDNAGDGLWVKSVTDDGTTYTEAEAAGL
jgi:hypothetical protein